MTALVAGAVGLLSATFPTSWTCALAPVEFVATDRLPSLASLLPSAIPSIEPPRSTASAAPRPPTVPSSGSVGNRNGYVRLAAAGSDDARPGAVSKLEPVDYLPPLRPTTPRGSTAAAVVLSVEPLVLQVAGPSLPVMVEPPPPEPPAPAPSDLRVTSPPAMQPVGKPILLLATVLGADGRPLPDAAVEWTIERQGVGEIRGVADDPRLGKPGDKRSPTFARSYTCNRGHRLRLAGDDQRQIDVAAGDAWCLVDSLQPGDMQLTVRSPDVTARPTAVTLRTHWRSAEAVFPSAKDALVVGPTVLETFVRETVGAAPLAGYRVRYRWKNPPVEAGGETIVATMEALTDADGRAAFRLPPPDLDPRHDWTLGPAGTVTRKPIASPDDTPAAPPNRIVPK
ncbi:MAG: hypothetical protein ACRDD1_14005, partial [Planctomycetia bacterium]